VRSVINPTVEVLGPAGKIVIDEGDLEAYRARGYQVSGEQASGTESGNEGSADTETQESVCLADLTVPELKEKAAALGIEGYANMKKAELVEQIQVKLAATE